MLDRTCYVELTARVLIWHSASRGGISSIGGSFMQAGGFSDPVMITGSAALGGLGSRIAGGNFWQGERGCSSHPKWLVAEVKRSYRPGTKVRSE